MYATKRGHGTSTALGRNDCGPDRPFGRRRRNAQRQRQRDFAPM